MHFWIAFCGKCIFLWYICSWLKLNWISVSNWTGWIYLHNKYYAIYYLKIIKIEETTRMISFSFFFQINVIRQNILLWRPASVPLVLYSKTKILDRLSLVIPIRKINNSNYGSGVYNILYPHLRCFIHGQTYGHFRLTSLI